MEYTTENLALVEKTHKITQGQKKMWAHRNEIPDIYFQEKINPAEARKIIKALNVPEIRSGRLETTALPSTISAFKNGIRELKTIHHNELKKSLNKISAEISNFARIPVEDSEEYLKRLLDLSDIPALNWREITKNIKDPAPHYARLRWSYYHSSNPNPEMIKNHEKFFKNLRSELKLLAAKIEI